MQFINYDFNKSQSASDSVQKSDYSEIKQDYNVNVVEQN